MSEVWTIFEGRGLRDYRYIVGNMTATKLRGLVLYRHDYDPMEEQGPHGEEWRDYYDKEGTDLAIMTGLVRNCAPVEDGVWLERRAEAEDWDAMYQGGGESRAISNPLRRKEMMDVRNTPVTFTTDWSTGETTVDGLSVAHGGVTVVTHKGVRTELPRWEPPAHIPLDDWLARDNVLVLEALG